MNTKACPDSSVMLALIQDSLGPSEFSVVSAHVEQCESCQISLETLSRNADSFGLQLIDPRRSSPDDTDIALPCDSFLARIKDSGLVKDTESGNPSPLSPFPIVAGYELLEEIGRGGVGIVFKARQTRLDRLVAIKVMHSGQRATPDDLERFRNEARVLATIDHPNIVQVFEVGDCDLGPYVVLEYVERGSLESKLKHQPQEAKQVAELIRALAEAVQFAHSHGIIHRDIKPANVLMASVPKLTDFGLAKRLDLESSQTRSGMILGTPSYMAPEQASGNLATAGPRTDVYGLGAVMYEALTGRPPFHAATAFETLLQVVHVDPILPRALQPNIPLDIESVCLKCLEKDMAKRYGSALELQQDLDRYLSGAPTHARPIGILGQASKWVRRHPLSASLVAAIATLLFTSTIALSILYRRSEIARIDSESQRDVALDANQRSEKAERGAKALNDFLLKQFLEAPSLRSGALGRDVTVLQMVEAAANKIDMQFKEQPELAATMHESVAETFQQFGEYDNAIIHHMSALELRRNAYGLEHPITLASEVELARIYSLKNQIDAADNLLIHAVPELTKQSGLNDRTRLAAVHEQAILERKKQHLDAALNLYQEVFDRSLDSLGEAHELTSQAALGLAEVAGNLKGASFAIPMLERAVEMVKKSHGSNSVAHLVVRGRLGEALLTSGQYDRAEPILRDVLEDRRNVIGPTHPTNFSILGWLADCWQANGELDRAKSAYYESIEGYHAAKMSDSPLIARAETRLGSCLTKLKAFEEAEIVLLDAQSRFAKIKTLRPEWVPLNRKALFDLYQAWDRQEDALLYETP